MALSWNRLGYILQAQTNQAGISSNWTAVDIPNTDQVTATNFPIDLQNPPVFFRLRSP